MHLFISVAWCRYTNILGDVYRPGIVVCGSLSIVHGCAVIAVELRPGRPPGGQSHLPWIELWPCQAVPE